MPIGARTTSRRASWPSGTCAPEGRRHDDLAQGFEVLAEVAVVAEVDSVALQALDRRGERHAAQGDFQDILHLADRKAVAGDVVAVDVELDVVAAHDALGVGAGGAGDLPHDRLDLRGDALQLREVGPATLMPTGVLMPVASMSMRVLMGMVQALMSPGNWIAAFIASDNSSGVRRRWAMTCRRRP